MWGTRLLRREPSKGIKRCQFTVRICIAPCSHDSGAEDDDPDTVVTRLPSYDEDDYQRPAKLDLLVGFLRLGNFLRSVQYFLKLLLCFVLYLTGWRSVFTAVWAVVAALLYPQGGSRVWAGEGAFYQTDAGLLGLVQVTTLRQASLP